MPVPTLLPKAGRAFNGRPAFVCVSRMEDKEMRKLIIVLVTVAFLAGASCLYAEEHKEDENDEGEYALAGDIQEVKRLLSEVLAELKKLNAVVAWETTSPTLYSLTKENNTYLKGIFLELQNR